ncbi:MAG TPA: RnfABCDGE type electron transport complex subunit D [Nonomuraea sp.]|nr:RnfABCDGE type electron transport complex subunit D [Nonomuraea sp.]
MGRDEPPFTMDGPPWIGPVASRSEIERQYLWVNLALSLSAATFFGWRAVWMVAAVTVAGLCVWALIALPVRAVTGRWPVAAGPFHALNVSMLLALTLPMSRGAGTALAISAAAVGLLVYAIGPAHRVRVHPVALAHLLLLLTSPTWDDHRVHAVLPPDRILRGDVMDEGPPAGGPTWLATHPTPPHPSIQRHDPGAVMLARQRVMLLDGSSLARILRPAAGEGDQLRLPRLVDVLIGGVPGPVGATSRLLLLTAGLYLMQRRLGRSQVALAALCGALAALLLVPVQDAGSREAAFLRFPDIGWRAAVTYLSFQILATPLPLIVLVLAPLTPPRSARGRMVYGAIIGAGVVLVRWYVPREEASYLPLVVAGLLNPALDRMRGSRFVRGRSSSPERAVNVEG